MIDKIIKNVRTYEEHFLVTKKHKKKDFILSQAPMMLCYPRWRLFRFQNGLGNTKETFQVTDQFVRNMLTFCSPNIDSSTGNYS